MRMIPLAESTTVIETSLVVNTGKPCGPISVHVSVALLRSNGWPLASNRDPSIAQSVAAISSVASWCWSGIASPWPRVVADAERTATPALVALHPGRAIEHEPDLDVFAAVGVFELAAQAGQGQRRQRQLGVARGDVAALRVERRIISRSRIRFLASGRIRKTGHYGISTADRPHSALMLRVRMTLPHFSVSSAMS